MIFALIIISYLLETDNRFDVSYSLFLQKKVLVRAQTHQTIQDMLQFRAFNIKLQLVSNSYAKDFATSAVVHLASH